MAKKKKKRMGSDPLSWVKATRKNEDESIAYSETSAPEKKDPTSSNLQSSAINHQLENGSVKKEQKRPTRKSRPISKKYRAKSLTSNIQSSITHSQLNITKRQFCTFWISGRLFGVDIQEVKEVNREMTITRIYHAASLVKGLVNIRGKINIVIDLRQLMGFDPVEMNEQSRIVIFKAETADAIGVLVDRVGDVVEVEEGAIEPIAKAKEDWQLSNDNFQLYSGVCKLNNALMVILNSGNLKNIEGTVQS